MCFSLPPFSIYRALKHEKKKHLTSLKFLVIKNIDLANCVSAHEIRAKQQSIQKAASSDMKSNSLMHIIFPLI